MGERQKGTVKWFNATKGFGFVTPEGGGEDLFVHQTNIQAEGFRSLREGEEVEFEVEAGPDGRKKAIQVSGPEGSAPQGAPPRSSATRGGFAGPTRGRGRGRGGRGFFPGYGYPMYFGYYFPAGGRGRGRGRGRGFPGRGRGRSDNDVQGVPGQNPVEGTATGEAEPTGLQVVVHNIPWTCTWQQLKDVFKEWKVERADVIYDSWGRSRGFGTVRFTQKEEAEEACNKLNNTQIEGRTISVRIDRFA